MGPILPTARISLNNVAHVWQSQNQKIGLVAAKTLPTPSVCTCACATKPVTDCRDRKARTNMLGSFDKHTLSTVLFDTPENYIATVLSHLLPCSKSIPPMSDPPRPAPSLWEVRLLPPRHAQGERDAVPKTKVPVFVFVLIFVPFMDSRPISACGKR